MFLSRISPVSVTPLSIPTNMKNPAVMEPLDYSSSPILDLCVRQKCPEQELHTKPNMKSEMNTKDTNKFIPAELDSSEDGSVASENYDISMYSFPTSLNYNIQKQSGVKPPRPFKAYPKDPFTFSMSASDSVLATESIQAYADFRKKMLSQVHNNRTGDCNPQMRRTSVTSSSAISENSGRDASYWEKRRKNNEAAKRSRDARRAKEDEIAIRAAFLEQENLKLKYEIVTLKNETSRLRNLVYK